MNKPNTHTNNTHTNQSCPTLKEVTEVQLEKSENDLPAHKIKRKTSVDHDHDRDPNPDPDLDLNHHNKTDHHQDDHVPVPVPVPEPHLDDDLVHHLKKVVSKLELHVNGANVDSDSSNQMMVLKMFSATCQQLLMVTVSEKAIRLNTNVHTMTVNKNTVQNK